MCLLIDRLLSFDASVKDELAAGAETQSREESRVASCNCDTHTQVRHIRPTANSEDTLPLNQLSSSPSAQDIRPGQREGQFVLC